MLVKTYAAALQSIHAEIVTIEVNVSEGTWFQLVGLPDAAIRESHERIKSAIEIAGYEMPCSNVVINMSPADLRKEGAAYDLPLAVGLLAADEQLPYEKLNEIMMMGELGL
ncbi:MAG: magnesium chelatase domain-containing protein, partial [Porphyromonadaceae bacterium]|nr:magnesium chelatase domain-containing protein [Porphyromonadaceae bacterium]